MRIQKIKNTNSIIKLLAVLFVVIALTLGGLFLFKLGPFAEKQTNNDSSRGATTEQKAQQQDVANKEKKDLAESDQGVELPGKDTPTPISSDTIDIIPSKDNGYVTIKTSLRGYSAGTCALSIKNDQKTINRQAEIIYQPEFSTCAGFSVLIDELGTGQWEINLDITPAGGDTISKGINFSV